MNNLTRNIASNFKRIAKFHYIFSVSLLLIGVAFTTYYINDILSNTEASTDTPIQVGFSDKFDTETIKKVGNFKYRDETTPPQSPPGRTNPFTE